MTSNLCPSFMVPLTWKFLESWGYTKTSCILIGFHRVSITHDGSMVLLYMVLHGSHQYTPFMLAYIPAPWILWVIKHPFGIIPPFMGFPIYVPSLMSHWIEPGQVQHGLQQHRLGFHIARCNSDGSHPGAESDFTETSWELISSKYTDFSSVHSRIFWLVVWNIFYFP